MATRRDVYDPITGRWVSERTAFARVASYSIAADRARERRRFGEADAYEAAVASFDIQTELLHAPPPRRELERVRGGATLPSVLRGYYMKARRLLDAWGFDANDAAIEWELGDDYAPASGRRGR